MVSLEEKAHRHILLSLQNAVFNKYNSVDMSRIRIIGTFSWTLMDFAIQSFKSM